MKIVDQYLCISAKDPGNFDSGNDYEITLVLDSGEYNKNNVWLANHHNIKISEEEFQKLKKANLVYEVTSEWPVGIWYFNFQNQQEGPYGV